MRVAIVNTYAKGATINRVISIINVLVDHEVHLVGLADQELLKLSLLQNKNVQVHHVPNNPSKSGNFLLRYVFEFLYAIKCSRKVKSLKANYEIITVPFISLIITSRLFKGSAVKILDVRDIQWEYLKESGLISRIVKKVLKGVHLFFLKKYDLITLTNPYEKSILDKYTVNIKKEIVSNGITQVQFDEIQQGLKARVKEQDGPLVITYVGNVGIAQNLGTFIETIKDFDKFELVIVGDGNDLNRLREMVENQQIQNVRFTGRVGVDQVFNYYNDSDFLWAKLDPNYLSAVPSKLYEYLATGKPLIYSGKGAAIDLLQKFENVNVIEDSTDSIVLFLKRMEGGEQTIKSSDFNVNLIRTNYIRETINQKFLKIIDSDEQE